jgi:hypothetical protein
MGRAAETAALARISQDDVSLAFDELYTILRQAYWVAGSIEGKDRLTGLAQAVYEIRMALDAQELKARTEEFISLTATVCSVNKRLEKLQADLDDLIHNLEVADHLVAGITKAVAAATAFGIL